MDLVPCFFGCGFTQAWRFSLVPHLWPSVCFTSQLCSGCFSPGKYFPPAHCLPEKANEMICVNKWTEEIRYKTVSNANTVLIFLIWWWRQHGSSYPACPRKIIFVEKLILGKLMLRFIWRCRGPGIARQSLKRPKLKDSHFPKAEGQSFRLID